jgi:broad specificity phosphatase PhoE
MNKKIAAGQKSRPKMLVLVRHGESKRNAIVGQGMTIPNTPESTELAKLEDYEIALTEIGEKQAVEAGRFLCTFGKFHKCYDSGWKRASDTRRMALQSAGYSPSQIEKLSSRSELLLRERERGFTRNMTKLEWELHPILRCWNEDYIKNPFQTRFLGGESVADVADRFREFRTIIHEHHARENVVVFCHEIVMRAALIVLLRHPIEQAQKTAVLKLPNCAVHVYRHTGRRADTWQFQAFHPVKAALRSPRTIFCCSVAPHRTAPLCCRPAIGETRCTEGHE